MSTHRPKANIHAKKASAILALAGLGTLLGLLAGASVAHAYIGPGAGFAVISSFLVLFVTAIVAFMAILVWPFRRTWLYFKRRPTARKSRVRRVVVLGLDGLDPALTSRFMRKGDLPNFQRLKDQGSFRPLQTTMPSISPVAWSTFSTGVNPGKHRIFDFYTRDPKNYLPVLSSVKISARRRAIKIGPFSWPIRRVHLQPLRKSTLFWKLLGKAGVFSTVLRVPITFPPEKFYGVCLSGMCVPDLRGSQGAFTCLTTERDRRLDASGVEGQFIHIDLTDDQFQCRLPGPSVEENGRSQPLMMPIKGKLNRRASQVILTIDGQRHMLQPGEYSPWIKLGFKIGWRRRIWGVARFLVTEIRPHLKIYVTPLHIDPEHPSLPISHPMYHSVYLSKLHGDFATLGLSEDTWALNERVIDEGAFLDQAYDIYKEREKHFTDALRKNRSGLVLGVFDTTDRIQHMFYRYLDPKHPANQGKDVERHRGAIAELYRKMDRLVGRVMSQLGPDDLLMVISDHGFKSFRWGVNLNTWLHREGYLVLKEGALPGREWLADVDWQRTRAFSLGLTGIFVNQKGRERQGIVSPGNERMALQIEIKEKLEQLFDETNARFPVRRCVLAQMALKGPYMKDAPDLLVGYRIGYRASWNSAVGKISEQVIENNTKSWSGDHAIDPQLVPGVFFSNWKIRERRPALSDLAPTILSLFGLPTQAFHDGKPLDMEPGDLGKRL